MKQFQFGTKSILLATAVVAITCGGVIATGRIWRPGGLSPIPYDRILLMFLANAPIWTPVVFVAFALGRKKLTVPMTIAFALMEAAAIGILYGILLYRSG